MKIHSSCEIEDFVETHLCKLCVILRSRVLEDRYIYFEVLHFLPRLSDFVPLKNELYSFRAQTDQHHHVDPDSYAVVPREVAGLYP